MLLFVDEYRISFYHTVSAYNVANGAYPCIIMNGNSSMLQNSGFSETSLIQIEKHPDDDTPQAETVLPPLTEAERYLLQVTWNGTSVAYPKEQCIHRLFEAQVEYTPEAAALVFNGQKLTYRELNEQANALAHRLRQLSVEPEVRVGLCVERSLEMVVGLLGILKAGGAYVPLDPAYPQERLAFMLEDAETTVLVTQQRLLDKLPPHKKVVCLDAEWQTIARESKENLATAMTSENLAYIMYTSGSSGQPKGVLGTHRAAINRFHWMWTTYPFAAGEVCCQKTALSFVDSVWEIFGPLLKGIPVVIIPDMVVKDPLSQHPTVREAVVVAHEDTSGDKRLVAYIVLHRGQMFTVSDLQSHMTKELPAYMVPSTFVELEALPLTPNGKVDRRALPMPTLVGQTGGEPFVAPKSMVHHQLSQIWEELLNVQPIGIQDNFFYLGGHSLLAARLVNRIELVFGRKLPLATLFAAPTIEQLALAMQSEEEKSSRTPLIPVQAGGSKQPFFYLHGAWHSDAFYCFYLAHYLGPDQPFYALPPYNLDGLLVAPTIEEMAAAHIQSIRTIQPEGPYLLGAFAMEGL
jgi:hypothetical protein